MSNSNENKSAVAAEAAPFRDEIFNWPIATLNNVHVWELLFKKYITHPTDQQNLIVASPQFFGPLLKERKSSNLFGEVVQLLHTKRYLTLRKQDFLNFRGLSKSCRISIDTMLQTNNECLLYFLAEIDHDTYHPEHDCYHSILPVEEMKEKIESYAESSFDKVNLKFGGPTPCLFVTDDDINRYPNFQTLVPSVGFKIYQLNIHLDWNSTTWNGNYRLIRSFLGSAPHLVTLKIWGFSSAEHNDMEWLDELRRYTEENRPLHNLKRLRALMLDEYVPSQVATVLFKTYAANLEHLVMLSENVFEAYLDSADLFSNANRLTNLTTCVVPKESVVSRMLSQNINWPASLRSIHIFFLMEEGDNILRLDDFEAFSSVLLQQFANAHHKISALSITMRIDDTLYDDGITDFRFEAYFLSSDFRIRLPFLKRLWIRSALLFYSNIDLILGVSNSLEELVLNLDWNGHRKEGAVELIWYVGYWHRMYESNIWEKMPKLQKLTIRVCPDGLFDGDDKIYEYSRGDYNRLSMADISDALHVLFLYEDTV